jgi:ribose transport system permease protein
VGILGTPTLALGAQYQLSTIAAVVLGGAALAGGRLRPAATLAGAVFLAVSNQGVATTGLPVGAQSVAQGAILIIAMLLVTTGLLRRMRDRRTAQAAGLDRADGLAPS